MVRAEEVLDERRQPGGGDVGQLAGEVQVAVVVRRVVISRIERAGDLVHPGGEDRRAWARPIGSLEQSAAAQPSPKIAEPTVLALAILGGGPASGSAHALGGDDERLARGVAWSV